MKRGFTIVELVVVIAVIGILASITTFAYRGWRQDNANTAVTTDLQAAAHAMDQYRNFNDVYPTTAQLKSTYKGKATVTVKALDSGKNFCLTGVGGSPETTLYFNSQDDSISETAC